MASSMGAQKARAMKSGSGAFDLEEFVSKLVTFMGGRKSLEDHPADGSDMEDGDDGDAPLNWEKIGRKALAKSRRVPAMGFMLVLYTSAYTLPDILSRLGPLSIEQKKRAPVKRAKLEKNKDEERKPQELKEEDISRSQNETTKNVATVSSILGFLACLQCASLLQLEAILQEEGQAINIFRFVINPNDFAQSVENIFYLSFLIRDGKVAFETDAGEPVICTHGPTFLGRGMTLKVVARYVRTTHRYRLCWWPKEAPESVRV